MSTVIFKKFYTFINQYIIQFLIKKIAHAIKRYVRIGCELTSGNDIEKAIEGLSGTSVAQIEPNRDKSNNNEVGNHDTNNTVAENPWHESTTHY